MIASQRSTLTRSASVNAYLAAFSTGDHDRRPAVGGRRLRLLRPVLQIADQQYHDLPEDLRALVDRRITGSPRWRSVPGAADERPTVTGSDTIPCML